MTQNDLQRGNELDKKMKILHENISLLDYTLTEGTFGEKIKRFILSGRGKNKIHIDGDDLFFGGSLIVDRECMEVIKNYFEKKYLEARAEFENIGKGGVGE